MTKREQKSLAQKLGAFFVDRHVYERRSGSGRFVTFTRQAQLRLFWLFLFLFIVAGLSTTGLVKGYGLYREQARELAALRAGAVPSKTAAAEAGDEAALVSARAEIEALRAQLAAAGVEDQASVSSAAIAEERAALEVEKRSITAELQAVKAQAKLLTEQLESSERQRAKLSDDIAALRRSGEGGDAATLDALKSQLVASEAAKIELQARLDQAISQGAAALAIAAPVAAGGTETDAGTTKAQTEKLSLDLALMRQERDAARSDLQAAMAKVAALEQQVAAASSRQEIPALQASLAAVMSERDSLRVELERLRDEREDLDVELTRLRSEAEELPVLRERVARAESELDRIALETVKNDVTGGVQQASVQATDVASAASRVAALDGQLRELKELGDRLKTIQQRNAALEAYLGRKAPPPPVRAPR